MIKFKFFKHLYTITHHRHLVFRHALKCGIGFQGLVHDLSKYNLVEFIPGVKYYKGTASPTENERLDKGFSQAWLHHKGRNKHHFEYWYDYNEKIKSYEPVKMPIKYVKEMFCDRLAASKTYLKKSYRDDSAYIYFVTHQARTLMHPATAELLTYWLEYLKDHGEKKTFKMIRKTKSY